MGHQGRDRRDRAGALTGLAAAIIALAAVAAYGNTFSVPFLFDDAPSIAQNSTLRHWTTALVPPLESTTAGRPILNLSLAFNYAIGGAQVWSYHVVNLLIHILAGLTLFGILRRTLDGVRHPRPCGRGYGDVAPRASAGTTTLPAFAIALLWTLHPLQTESVTYIVQRGESLAGLFYLLTLYCFIRHAEKVGLGGPARPFARANVWMTAERTAGRDRPALPLWAGLSVVFCLLAMGTKEVAASAPLIVFLYDRTFVAGSFREAWRRRWRVHAALAATWAVLFLLVLSAHGRNQTASFSGPVSPFAYALTQLPAILHYLRLCFWPHPLVFDYGSPTAALAPGILFPFVIVGGLAAVTVWALFKRPALGFLGASFFAILAPSSSVVPVATQTMAEHRMYLPLACVIVVAVWCVRRAASLFRRSNAETDSTFLTLLPMLGLSAVAGVLTFHRNEVYSGAESLWTDTVAGAPRNARARNNLADALASQPGRQAEAIAQYEEIVRQKPDLPEVRCRLANLLAAVPGQADEAAAQFQEALRLKPDIPEAHCGLGDLWVDALGRLDDAIAEYREAVREKPDYGQAHNNLGSALSRMPGRLDEAIGEYRQALRLIPDSADAHFNLAVALLRLGGREAEARDQLAAVLRLQPGDPQARELLGRLAGATP